MKITMDGKIGAFPHRIACIQVTFKEGDGL